MSLQDNTIIKTNDDATQAQQKGEAQPSSPHASTHSHDHHHHHHHRRSAGLRAFDIALYPILTNVGVFIISVAATYLTSKGGEKDASGKLIHGKTGEFFHKRGAWLTEKFKKTGMSDSSADMSKMVFFSFTDGTLLAPLVKLLEDRRERIGKWLDDRFDTRPDNPDAYKCDPKQTWGSVLAGRAATVAIVVPTAVALDKAGLNDTLFRNPSKKLAAWIENRPRISRLFGKFDAGELAKISLFEGFYTSVCTAGLYVSSRFFARKITEHKEKKQEALAAPSSPPPADDGDAPRSFASDALKKKSPLPPAPSHAARIASEPAATIGIA